MRQVEKLDRDGDPGDLTREPGDGLSDVEAAERRRLPQRRNVDRQAAKEAGLARR